MSYITSFTINQKQAAPMGLLIVIMNYIYKQTVPNGTEKSLTP